jgi:hypothetical protein
MNAPESTSASAASPSRPRGGTYSTPPSKTSASWHNSLTRVHRAFSTFSNPPTPRVARASTNSSAVSKYPAETSLRVVPYKRKSGWS